ncbi:hypothetical protein EMPS_01827 [Entomortierella parvispora]|uniref:Uncharacterized protein n=1 Tax=Entomortierella parvispora TaxID=205924 RepID=A0A9P3H3M1_9FUNG|nr:hypothetical protein EMPS_01827 [Entomortierella parvispora]
METIIDRLPPNEVYAPPTQAVLDSSPQDTHHRHHQNRGHQHLHHRSTWDSAVKPSREQDTDMTVTETDKDGHKRHRRRKAQFELGGEDQTEEEDMIVETTQESELRQVEVNNNNDKDDDDTEGEDSHAMTHPQGPRSSNTRPQSAQHKQETDDDEEGSAVAVNGRVVPASDPQTSQSREDDSLAKTLIDSTLTRSMQDLGLDTNNSSSRREDPHHPAPPREQRDHANDASEHQQEPPQIAEPTEMTIGTRQQRNDGPTLSASDPVIRHQHVEPQEHERHQERYLTQQAPSRSNSRDSDLSRSPDRTGHSMEKSKSSPGEGGSSKDAESISSQKSPVSISGSPKPRHRALSRASPKSKRMSMLLDPSASTTSLPSLTKVTTHTVMAVQPASGMTSVEASPSTNTLESSRQSLKMASPTLQPSPAVELVSKFLNQTAAGTSAHHSEDHHHLQVNGSPNSLRRNPRNNSDKSSSTSPQQRAGYTSKFYPVSPSQPLSSSAPKSTMMANNLIPPTIVTTMSTDEHLQGGDGNASATPWSAAPPSSASAASAIAAAAVAQSNLAGNGSKAGALSRTQQKLWLQRENLQDVDEDEMARRGRMQKEMERINKEYKCVRMTLDPAVESILRCLARCGKSPLQLQQQAQSQGRQQPQAGSNQDPVPERPQTLQHHRSLQHLNGHHSVQAAQQQQGNVGLGLNPPSNYHPSGAATMGRDQGKMTLRQMQQLQQQQVQHQQQQQQHHHQRGALSHHQHQQQQQHRG